MPKKKRRDDVMMRVSSETRAAAAILRERLGMPASEVIAGALGWLKSQCVGVAAAAVESGLGRRYFFDADLPAATRYDGGEEQLRRTLEAANRLEAAGNRVEAEFVRRVGWAARMSEEAATLERMRIRRELAGEELPAGYVPTRDDLERERLEALGAWLDAVPLPGRPDGHEGERVTAEPERLPRPGAVDASSVAARSKSLRSTVSASKEPREKRSQSGHTSRDVGARTATKRAGGSEHGADPGAAGRSSRSTEPSRSKPEPSGRKPSKPRKR